MRGLRVAYYRPGQSQTRTRLGGSYHVAGGVPAAFAQAFLSLPDVPLSSTPTIAPPTRLGLLDDGSRALLLRDAGETNLSLQGDGATELNLD